MVHEIFSLQDLNRARRENPEAVVVAHPECPRNILEVSDFIGGTEKMRRHVMSVPDPTTFLVATEANMIYALEHSAPQHTFVPVPGVMESTGETCACNRCPHMARNTLSAVRDCLKGLSPRIEWQPHFDAARDVVVRSLLD